MPQFSERGIAKQILEKLEVEIHTLSIANAYMKSRRMTIGEKNDLADLNNLIQHNQMDIDEKRRYQDFIRRTFELDRDEMVDPSTRVSFKERLIALVRGNSEG